MVGLRAAASLHIAQWWRLAKRHAFRQWSYLLNSSSGIFLVTRCLKTKRLAQCLTKGAQGSITQIHVAGLGIPQDDHVVVLPTNWTRWTLGARNELNFEIHPELDDEDYTIFIEMDASSMFVLANPILREVALRLWRYVPYKLVFTPVFQLDLLKMRIQGLHQLIQICLAPHLFRLPQGTQVQFLRIHQRQLPYTTD
jgi:hypothetical protein